MKRNYILIMIAAWGFLTAAGALIGVYIVVYESWLDPEIEGPPFALSVAFIVVLSVYFGFAVAAGVGLLKVKRWGRVAAMVHAALNLPLMPVGTIIGALTLVYLLRSKLNRAPILSQ